MRKEKIVYFDLLRIMATFAVIVIHVCAEGWYLAPNTLSWEICNFFDGISRWAVPIFCMISGALFLDVDKKINTKSLYTKNISRIVTSFIFWSVIYAVFLAFLKNEWNILEITKSILTGTTHMWFLFMIVGFYIAVPIIRKITENKNVAIYFILVAFVATFLIPQLLNFRPFSYAGSIVEKMKFKITMGYTPYFIMGLYIHKYGVSKKIEKVIYVLGVLAFIGTIVATSFFSKRYGAAYSGFFKYLTVNVLFESLAVFLFAKNVLSKIKFSDKALGAINTLSRDTFGMYLVHILFIEILFKINLKSIMVTPLLWVPVTSFIVFALSWVVSHILNSIPVVKKYIV